MPKKRINKELVAQAIRVFEDRSHPGLAKAKTRGEVSISTRKIYKQKGTGGARHGAKSAPIFVGGGVAHGPKGVKRVLNLPKKMAKKALGEVLKIKSDEMKLFIEDKILSFRKTKEAGVYLDKLSGGKKGGRGTLVIFGDEGFKAGRLVFRNIEGVSVVPAGSVNAYDIFKAGRTIMDRAAANTFGLVVKVEKTVKIKKVTRGKKVKK